MDGVSHRESKGDAFEETGGRGGRKNFPFAEKDPIYFSRENVSS